MIELPESHTYARQLNECVKGRRVDSVVAGHSPHKFCFFHEDPAGYDALLRGRVIGDTHHYGGHVEIEIEDMRLDFHDGLNLRWLPPGTAEPAKHQLLVRLDDGGMLVGSVQMYAGVFAFPVGTMDNMYYDIAREKPDPLTDAFDRAYFDTLLAGVDKKKLSAKAFLATEQRIPGLGNGTLQDILWRAGIHPKKKMHLLDGAALDAMYTAVKDVLREMTDAGGRDTEKTLHGEPGGYKTVMSKQNKAMVCPACGGTIKKEAYLGGNVYSCPNCQPLGAK